MYKRQLEEQLLIINESTVLEKWSKKYKTVSIAVIQKDLVKRLIVQAKRKQKVKEYHAKKDNLQEVKSIVICTQMKIPRAQLKDLNLLL